MVAALADIVPKLYAADEQFGIDNGIDPYQTFEEALGAPASASEVDELEMFLRRRLPPSYRAFLSLYNGWHGVPGCGGADLLGAAGHRDPHVQNTLRWKSDMFNEFEASNPIEAGAIPLAIGDDRNMILLEGPARADGEMDVVKYYLTGEEGRFSDLLAYFQDALRQATED